VEQTSPGLALAVTLAYFIVALIFPLLMRLLPSEPVPTEPVPTEQAHPPNTTSSVGRGTLLSSKLDTKRRKSDVRLNEIMLKVPICHFKQG